MRGATPCHLLLVPSPTGRRTPLTTQGLVLEGTWFQEGRLFARWSPASRALLKETKLQLYRVLRPKLRPSCTHLKGHGGVKGAIRALSRLTRSFRYVARFDVARYYESIDHATLLELLTRLGVSREQRALTEEALRLPDRSQRGVGLVAGCSLSPLLAGVMLSPLDEAMHRLSRRGEIATVRYMDDFVVLAKKRHPFRRALKRVYRVINQLRLRLHETKRRIGKVARGFSFLGYHFKPGQRLRPSRESHRRRSLKCRRLYERGASPQRLWQYLSRWCRWHWGGLGDRVSRRGGVKGVFVRELKALGVKGCSLPKRAHRAAALCWREPSASG